MQVIQFPFDFPKTTFQNFNSFTLDCLSSMNQAEEKSYLYRLRSIIMIILKINKENFSVIDFFHQKIIYLLINNHLLLLPTYTHTHTYTPIHISSYAFSAILRNRKSISLFLSLSIYLFYDLGSESIHRCFSITESQ